MSARSALHVAIYCTVAATTRAECVGTIRSPSVAMDCAHLGLRHAPACIAYSRHRNLRSWFAGRVLGHEPARFAFGRVRAERELQRYAPTRKSALRLAQPSATRRGRPTQQLSGK